MYGGARGGGKTDGMIGKNASDPLRRELARYPGGGMFELGCHLIDAAVTVLGPPDHVTPFTRRTRQETDSFADNQLAVLEYPRALAVIRCNHTDPFGGPRRMFAVTGDQGTAVIRPLEPPALTLDLSRPAGPWPAGRHEVELPAARGRYHGEFEELAAALTTPRPLRWDSAHDLATHEAVLRASGAPLR